MKIFKPLFGDIEFEIGGKIYSISKITNQQGQAFIEELSKEHDKDADPSGLKKSVDMLAILLSDVDKETIRGWDMGATVDLVKYLSEVITAALTGTVGGTEKNASSPAQSPPE